MGAIQKAWCGVLLLAGGGVAGAQDKVGTEQDVAAKLLRETIKLIEPKVKGDERALQELRKLQDPDKEDLARITRNLKEKYKIDRLTPESVRTVREKVTKAVDEADADKLKEAIKKGDGTIVVQICWIWRCP